MIDVCVFERSQNNSFWTGGDGLQILRVTAYVHKVADNQVVGGKGDSCKVFCFEFCPSDFNAAN
jgi:hypothetical protein